MYDNFKPSKNSIPPVPVKYHKNKPSFYKCLYRASNDPLEKQRRACSLENRSGLQPKIATNFGGAEQEDGNRQLLNEIWRTSNEQSSLSSLRGKRMLW